MAIDPTAPVTPLIPAVPAGTPPDAAILAQALARQALSDATARLIDIVGHATDPAGGDKAVGQASQASTQDAGHAADPSPTKGAPSASAAPTRATPETRIARAVRTAAAEAVPRQAGLAPLMANVRALVELPDAPVAVREAGEALLARTPSAAEIITPQGLRRAIERSGVFLEATVARSVSNPTPDVAPRAIETGDLKAALLVFKGAVSAWLARAAPPIAGESPPAAPPRAPPSPPSSLASEPAVTASPAPAAAPPSSLDGAETPTASPPETGPRDPVQVSPRPPEVSPRGAEIKTEAPPEFPGPQGDPSVGEDAPIASPRDLALPRPPASPVETPRPREPSPSPSPPPSLSGRDALEPRFAGFTAPPRSPGAPVSPDRGALPAVVQLGLIETEEAAPPLISEGAPPDARPLVARAYGAAPAEARAKAPSPPYAGGPMAGQKPVPPDAPTGLPMVDLVRRLLKGTSAALARQDLMQIASLPEAPHHDSETPEARTPAARLNLDLPFVTPQGVAVAQMEISRDGGGEGGGAVGPVERTYRARFSIDVEPLGPVHALVTLTGARARVSLWAERAETIARLRAGEESLGAALREAELSPEVAVHSGAPPGANGDGPLGHFVDQAS